MFLIGLLTFSCARPSPDLSLAFLYTSKPQAPFQDRWNWAFLLCLRLKTNFLQFPANHSFSSDPECDSISRWGSLTPMLCFFFPSLLQYFFSLFVLTLFRHFLLSCNSLSRHLSSVMLVFIALVLFLLILLSFVYLMNLLLQIVYLQIHSLFFLLPFFFFFNFFLLLLSLLGWILVAQCTFPPLLSPICLLFSYSPSLFVICLFFFFFFYSITKNQEDLFSGCTNPAP